MNNHPAVRTQVDGMQDEYSFLGGLDTSSEGLPDMARQEFKDEADVNKILSRYGVNAPGHPPVFGETDFDLDLQTAIHAIGAAKNAYAKLPATLKERYPTWQSVLNGLDSGAFKLDLSDSLKKVTPDPASTDPGVT